jgi:hypothetical protein
VRPYFHITEPSFLWCLSLLGRRAFFFRVKDKNVMRYSLLISLVLFTNLLPAFAQSPPAPGYIPPLIRITGAIFDPKEQFHDSFANFDVRINEKPWILRVRDVESLTTNVPGGLPLLRNLGGFLILSGPPELTARLESEEHRGHPVTIEGRLYVEERVLTLTAVEPSGPVSQ